MCVVGGGPAGMVTGLLLARAGINVTVLEKHADFFRDFRGDTIHPSTLELLHQLGWDADFLTLPHQRVERVTVSVAGQQFQVADFTRLPVHHRYIALVPQWDFLSFLADKAAALPAFSLQRNTTATGLLTEGDTVVGVTAERDGEPIAIRAGLVIGADGRHSTVRSAAGLAPTSRQSPIDVWWFRLPRNNNRDSSEEFTLFTSSPSGVLISINRGDYWQLAYVLPHGAGAALRDQGLDEFRRRVAGVQPALRRRLTDDLTCWDQVHELTVRVDRLRRWHRPGLLCIGDAAHAMSPAGGVGINLAIADAVATANRLGPILRQGRTPGERDLDAVRRRRALPVAITQFVQTRLLRGMYPTSLERRTSLRPPRALRVLNAVPALRRLTGRFVGLGLRRERLRDG